VLFHVIILYMEIYIRDAFVDIFFWKILDLFKFKSVNISGNYIIVLINTLRYARRKSYTWLLGNQRAF
jgi:hypothetical protein